MFRDREEELARLEAELLAEEEPEETGTPEDDTDYEEAYDDGSDIAYDGEYEEDYDEDYEEDYEEDPEEADPPYQAEYPTYDTGYHAYNTDRSDTDLEDYSEAVRTAKRSGCLTGAMIVLCLITLGVLGLLALILYSRGLL